MVQVKVTAPDGQLLSDDEIRNTLGVLEGQFTNQRVLVLIPDHTRSLPLPFLFRALVDVLVLHSVKQLDFMMALGTHPPLSEESLNKLVGITVEERATTFKHVGLHMTTLLFLDPHFHMKWSDFQAGRNISSLASLVQT
jgi:lactate racemase